MLQQISSHHHGRDVGVAEKIARRHPPKKAHTRNLASCNAPEREVVTMHEFLSNTHEELIVRCKAKVAQRPRRAATPEQLKNGVPLFLEQLTKTLRLESGFFS